MKRYWKEYAEKRRDEGKNSEYVLLNQEVELSENNKIRITLTNSVQLNFLERIRTDLIQFLREKLENDLISIEPLVIEPEENAMVYTPKEKFNYLAEKYPNLKILQEKLSLDTDF